MTVSDKRHDEDPIGDSVEDYVFERAPAEAGKWLSRGEPSNGNGGGNRKRKPKPSPPGAVFPIRKRSWWSYKVQLANEMRAIGAAMPDGKAKRRVLQRAERSLLCGRVTKARACRACGSVREGSGVQTHPEKGYPCNLRTCATCARRQAQKRRQEIKAITENPDALPRVQNYGWKMVTLTMQYDPTNENELTIEALRARVVTLQKAIKLAWKRGLKQRGSAMVVTIELSGVGNVHCHFLYYGPYINKDWLEITLKEVSPKMGHTDIRAISEESQNKAILEVAKYLGKSPSPLSERWIEGDEREVLHPRLAARWEVATMGVHLTINFGAFRNAAARKGLTETEESDDERSQQEDAETECQDCGVVGEWHWVHQDTLAYVRAMHERGMRAFSGSRWAPPRASPRAVYTADGSVVLVDNK